MADEKSDWTITIFVPEGEAAPAEGREDDPAKEHSLAWLTGGREAKVDAKSVKDQWAETIQAVLGLGASVTDQQQGWRVDEIEVGLTLSAKGKLMFIAEAGAEASIKLKLVRH